jgi:protein-tyrosine phosphatase
MPSLNNPGPISVHTLEALEAKEIKGKNLKRFPRPIEKQDFAVNDRIIVMSEKEHRPMIEQRFLGQADSAEYFEVGDLPVETPELAILKITYLVEKLVTQIKCAEKKEGQFIDC